MFYGVKEREYVLVNKVFFLLLMPNLNVIDSLIEGCNKIVCMLIVELLIELWGEDVYATKRGADIKLRLRPSLSQ